MGYNRIEGRLTSSDYARLQAYVSKGQKLSAIKYVRDKTGAGLAEAKTFVEANFDFPEYKAQSKKKQGCYVATCVYGSYDCPSVWVLRRYRDYTLAASRLGRAFIRIYYAVSPTAVRLFGKTRLFKHIFKARLDRMVTRLRDSGVEDTPYEDLY